jgi:putative Ca2+/H+ antiporter (TMEM165/GDT1 family)
VVAGASTAFGGWTALEILLGDALEGALPELLLDGITAGLFLVFAI